MSTERCPTAGTCYLIEAGSNLAEHRIICFRLCNLQAVVEENFRGTNRGLHHRKSDFEIQTEHRNFQNLVGEAVGDGATDPQWESG